MRFFDFSDAVERAVREAQDDVSRLCARTTIGRQRFPDAAAKAGFSMLAPGQLLSPSSDDHVLVVGIATWSDPDLAALDRLAVDSQNREVKVVVFDVDDWSLSDILSTFTNVKQIHATPVVFQYRNSQLTFQGEGRDAALWLEQF
jgi:hypothetical protein